MLVPNRLVTIECRDTRRERERYPSSRERLMIPIYGLMNQVIHFRMGSDWVFPLYVLLWMMLHSCPLGGGVVLRTLQQNHTSTASPHCSSPDHDSFPSSKAIDWCAWELTLRPFANIWRINLSLADTCFSTGLQTLVGDLTMAPVYKIAVIQLYPKVRSDCIIIFELAFESSSYFNVKQVSFLKLGTAVPCCMPDIKHRSFDCQAP